MGTKQVRLDQDLYEWIESRKEDGETFSEAIERLTRRPSLLEIPDVLDDDAVQEAKEAAAEARGRKDRKGRAREAFE